MTEYLIKVDRKRSKGTGTLSYKSNSLTLTSDCWFNRSNPISARTYTKCSATHMERKLNSTGGKREGVFLPNTQTGRDGIFIHMGTSDPVWSNGCIVLSESKLLRMWNDIRPKNGYNVTVSVKDI